MLRSEPKVPRRLLLAAAALASAALLLSSGGERTVSFRTEPASALFTPRSDGSAAASVTGVDDAEAVLVNTEQPGGAAEPTSAVLMTATLS